MPFDALPLFAPKELCRPAVERLAAALPADDAALDALLEDASRKSDLYRFFPVMLAAIFAERSVDARHLVAGAPLLESPEWLAAVAWRMRGDVSACLVESVESRAMNRAFAAAALVIAAKWNRERGAEAASPRLLACARRMARSQHNREKVENPFDSEKHISYLWALSELVNDEALHQLVRETTRESERDLESKIIDLAKARATVLYEIIKVPFQQLFHEKPVEPKSTIAEGRTVRRAAPRVGRNEPCPCGSGKKYKRCCFEKDSRRLHDSSAVAGKTKEELRYDPEAQLTRHAMKHIPLEQWPRIDPLKVPPDLFPDYLKYLGALRFFDRAVEAIQLVGYKPEWEKAWEDLVSFATVFRDAGAVRKLFELRPMGEDVEVSLAAHLLSLDDDPAKKLAAIEESALESLRRSDVEPVASVAQSLLISKLPALGILVARGAIPLLPPDLAARIFQSLLDARDRLNLPLDDPFSDIIDAQLLQRRDSEHDDDAAALRQAQRNLEKKAAEVRELKEELARAQRDLDLRERREKRAAAEAAPASEDEKKETSALRARLDKMKTALKQIHSERNEFRRDLEQAHAEMEKMRAEQPAPPESEEPDREETLLLPPEPTSNQPVRMLEFPKKFDETLRSVPRHIARSTMVTLGQIAGGEPAGFVGARRLNVCEDITRQRIGSDYRLLFRLLPDRVQVVTLINRRDLDRTIKSLV